MRNLSIFCHHSGLCSHSDHYYWDNENMDKEFRTRVEGNAMLKAEYIYKNYGLDCFADDTGQQ